MFIFLNNLYFISRILTGTSCGINMALAPVYIKSMTIKGNQQLYSKLIPLSLQFGYLFGLLMTENKQIQYEYYLMLQLIPIIFSMVRILLFSVAFTENTPEYYYFIKKNEKKGEQLYKRIHNDKIPVYNTIATLLNNFEGDHLYKNNYISKYFQCVLLVLIEIQINRNKFFLIYNHQIILIIMSLSDKWSHNQFQKNLIDPQEVEPVFKEQRQQETNNENSDGVLSKLSTSNENGKQLSDSKSKPFHQDELQTNIYDLEQLNYRLFMNKEYERSFRLQQRLMKMIDGNPEYYHQRSLTYLALNDIKNAQLWYDKSTKICLYYVRYFFDYEIVAYLPKEFVDSIKYIQNNIDCYKEQENQLIAECFFAYNVFLSQRPQKAIKMLMKLIQRYPKCYLPYFYASKCYYHNQDYQQGLEFINLAIMNFRYKDLQLYNLKGKIQIQRRDFEDAMRIYSIFPDNKYFKQQVGNFFFVFYKKSQRTSLVWKQYNKKIEVKRPQSKSMEKKKRNYMKKVQIYSNSGQNFYKQWNYEESRDCFIKALEKYPSNGLFQFMLAKCYFKLGDFKNAQNYSNIASSCYEVQERVVKLQYKIQNEIKRWDKEAFKTCQIRNFF